MEVKPPEQSKQMRNVITEKTIAELQSEGWEEFWSFHHNNLTQWNDACNRVEKLQKSEDWKVIMIFGETEYDKKGFIAYLYKKRTPEREKWAQEHGYVS